MLGYCKNWGSNGQKTRSASANGGQMVIERKSVVWPPSYILRHNNEHDFAKAISEVTRPRYHDACYELKVSGRQVESLDKVAIRAIAKGIGIELLNLKPSDLPVHSSIPINWSFRRADAQQHGEHRGIVVLCQDSIELEKFLDDSAKTETASAMQKELSAASLKFNGYSDMRKVVLLDFYVTDLYEDDIPALLATVSYSNEYR